MTPRFRRTTRKLILRREALRHLDSGNLAQVRGGITGGYPGQSGGPCTESCSGCTIDSNSEVFCRTL